MNDFRNLRIKDELIELEGSETTGKEIKKGTFSIRENKGSLCLIKIDNKDYNYLLPMDPKVKIKKALI